MQRIGVAATPSTGDPTAACDEFATFGIFAPEDPIVSGRGRSPHFAINWETPRETNMPSMKLADALTCIAAGGASLADTHRLEWSQEAQQAALALRFARALGDSRRPSQAGDAARLSLVAIIGGASSGKSTVFNNLLGGRLTSRVTARGHSTLGPIVAVHDACRESVAEFVSGGLLFPTFAHRPTGLDDNITGRSDAVHVVHHNVDALRHVVLCDMPDLTSEPARAEGDVALATLPWFDRLIVLVDHERWFDRQTIGRLHDRSVRFGQERIVLFNRAREGPMPAGNHDKLVKQAGRLEARHHWVLEFRRGRGLCTFPPDTFTPLLEAINAGRFDRNRPLLRFLGSAATVVLNNNAERSARLGQLKEALHHAAGRMVPSASACLTRLMTPEEKRHLDVVSRTLRITETREWLQRQADRIRLTLRRHVPVVGPILAGSLGDQGRNSTDPGNRQSNGWDFFASNCARQIAAIREAAENSDFWEEVRRWVSIDLAGPDAGLAERSRPRIGELVANLDAALAAWNHKVETECRGVSPHLVGAVGGTTLAGAIVLVAVSGPVGALTLPVATGVLAHAFGTLATSAGVGALAGRPLNRLMSVVREKLIGSPEFNAVQASADAFRQAVVDFGRNAADLQFAQAESLVLDENDDLIQALGAIQEAGEDA